MVPGCVLMAKATGEPVPRLAGQPHGARRGRERRRDALVGAVRPEGDVPVDPGERCEHGGGDVLAEPPQPAVRPRVRLRGEPDDLDLDHAGLIHQVQGVRSPVQGDVLRQPATCRVDREMRRHPPVRVRPDRRLDRAAFGGVPQQLRDLLPVRHPQRTRDQDALITVEPGHLTAPGRCTGSRCGRTASKQTADCAPPRSKWRSATAPGTSS